MATRTEFGIFSVGDVHQDVHTKEWPTEHERIMAMMNAAVKAEEAGLDVYATGEHHNRPFVPSSPTTMLAYAAAKTNRIKLSTSLTLITTNDPVKIAEDYAMLQHLSEGRMDLMLGRGNTAPVYPWFGRSIQDGWDLTVENYALLRRLWREDVVDWEGKFRTPLQGFTSTPRPLDGKPPVVWHGAIRSPEVTEHAAFYGDPYFLNNLFMEVGHFKRLVDTYRERFEYYGHGPGIHAKVGAGSQVFIAKTTQEAIRQYRPYFNNTPIYRGAQLEDMAGTGLVVGSPQQVIEKVLSFRESFGTYHRQLFNLDMGGLPESMVLEQIELLGAEVVPTLRKEFDAANAAAGSDPDSLPEQDHRLATTSA